MQGDAADDDCRPARRRTAGRRGFPSSRSRPSPRQPHREQRGADDHRLHQEYAQALQRLSRASPSAISPLWIRKVPSTRVVSGVSAHGQCSATDEGAAKATQPTASATAPPAATTARTGRGTVVSGTSGCPQSTATPETRIAQITAQTQLVSAELRSTPAPQSTSTFSGRSGVDQHRHARALGQSLGDRRRHEAVDGGLVRIAARGRRTRSCAMATVRSPSCMNGWNASTVAVDECPRCQSVVHAAAAVAQVDGLARRRDLGVLEQPRVEVDALLRQHLEEPVEAWEALEALHRREARGGLAGRGRERLEGDRLAILPPMQVDHAERVFDVLDHPAHLRAEPDHEQPAGDQGGGEDGAAAVRVPETSQVPASAQPLEPPSTHSCRPSLTATASAASPSRTITPPIQ